MRLSHGLSVFSRNSLRLGCSSGFTSGAASAMTGAGTTFSTAAPARVSARLIVSAEAAATRAESPGSESCSSATVLVIFISGSR